MLMAQMQRRSKLGNRAVKRLNDVVNNGGIMTVEHFNRAYDLILGTKPKEEVNNANREEEAAEP
jgi:hypothetical protein